MRDPLRPPPRPLLAHPLLQHERLPLIAALLAIVLSLPALWGGLQGDDWFHLATMRRVGLQAEAEPLLDLFTFFDGGAGAGALREAGLVGWWAAPDLRVVFLRPVSAATHLLDEALWPRSPALAHAHSLAWAGALVGLGALLLRRFSGAGAAAGLGALLFAVEDAHAVGFGWVANRNALVALTLGLGALLLHLEGRAAGRWGPRAAALGLFGLALLAGESAVAAGAYLVAWELCLGPGGWRARAAALAPWAAALVLWRLGYQHFGFGAEGSALYIDPGREPLRFAAAVAQRLPLLVAGQLGQLPIDAWAVAPRAGRALMVAAAALVSAGGAALLLPTLRRSAPARALALGAVLSAIPLCAAFPMERLLLAPSLGCAGLLGLALTEGAPGRGLRLLGLLHGPLAAALLVLKIGALPLQGAVFAEAEVAGPRDAALAGQRLVFVNGNDFAPVYLAVIRWLRADAPAPAGLAVLWPRTTGATVTRVDAHTLRLAGDGPMLDLPLEGLLRDPQSRPFEAGQRIAGAGFEVRVEQVEDGLPLVISARFDQPLDDPGLRLVAFTADGLVPFPALANGEAQRLPATLPLQGLPVDLLLP